MIATRGLGATTSVCRQNLRPLSFVSLRPSGQTLAQPCFRILTARLLILTRNCARNQGLGGPHCQWQASTVCRRVSPRSRRSSMFATYPRWQQNRGRQSPKYVAVYIVDKGQADDRAGKKGLVAPAIAQILQERRREQNRFMRRVGLRIPAL